MTHQIDDSTEQMFQVIDSVVSFCVCTLRNTTVFLLFNDPISIDQ